jgi:hypothetical protein
VRHAESATSSENQSNFRTVFLLSRFRMGGIERAKDNKRCG